MLRYAYIVLSNLYKAPYFIPKLAYQAKRPEIYSEKQRYELVRHVVRCLKNAGRVHTECFGLDNLPKEGGYIMYPNHQGKYDALGIMITHDNPCTFVMDEAKSYRFLIKEIADCLQAKRLKKDDIRQSLQIINEVAEETAKGRRYILFPEGGYEYNGNTVCDFKPGSFKCAIKAQVPIVPVALIDSYRVFTEWSLGKVNTQVHYLKPITYEEYRKMKTTEISKIVKERIENVVNQFSNYMLKSEDIKNLN